MLPQYPSNSTNTQSCSSTGQASGKTPEAVPTTGTIGDKKGAPLLNKLPAQNEKQTLSKISDRLAKDTGPQKALADTVAALQALQDGIGSGKLTVSESSRLQQLVSGHEATLAKALSDGTLSQAEQTALNDSLKGFTSQLSQYAGNQSKAASSDTSRWAVASDLGRNIGQYESLLTESRNGNLNAKELSGLVSAQSSLHDTFAKVTTDNNYQGADRQQVDKLLSGANIPPALVEHKATMAAIKSNLNELKGMLNGVAAGKLTLPETRELLDLFSIVEATQSKLLQDGALTNQEALSLKDAQTRLEGKIAQLSTNAANMQPQDNSSRWELAAQLQGKIDAQQSLLDELRKSKSSGKDAAGLLARDNSHTKTLGNALRDGSIDRKEEAELDGMIDKLAAKEDKPSTPITETPPSVTPQPAKPDPITDTRPGVTTEPAKPDPLKPQVGTISDSVLDRLDRILQQISLSGTDYSRGPQGATPTSPQAGGSQSSPAGGFDRMTGQKIGGNSADRWEDTSTNPIESAKSDFFARLDNLMHLIRVRNNDEPRG